MKGWRNCIKIDFKWLIEISSAIEYGTLMLTQAAANALLIYKDIDVIFWVVNRQVGTNALKNGPGNMEKKTNFMSQGERYLGTIQRDDTSAQRKTGMSHKIHDWTDYLIKTRKHIM